MAKFELYKDKAGEFRFRLKAKNGQNILKSEAYKSKSNCENGINAVKLNATNQTRYQHAQSKNGEPYFNLKAANGKIIGTSEMYSSVSAMENGIASVKSNAPVAEVDYLY